MFHMQCKYEISANTYENNIKWQQKGLISKKYTYIRTYVASTNLIRKYISNEQIKAIVKLL